MTVTQYDAIPPIIANIPADAEAVAGYTDGIYAWSAADWARFPDAHHLTITIGRGGRARCLDVEQGAAGVGQVPGFLGGGADTSDGLPVLYGSASIVGQLISTAAAAGHARDSYLVWSAHYNRQPHICGPNTCGFPQADGTQYDDHYAGRSCDVSLLSDRFYPATPPAPPQPPEDDAMIFVVVKQDGRLEAFVEDSKGAVWHAWQTAKDGGWAGAAKGKNAAWYSLGTPGKSS